MDEIPQSSRPRNTEPKNYDINNNKKTIKNSDFIKCLINCYSFSKNKFKKCQSNCSIMNQFIFYLLPFSFLIAFSLILIHIYLFEWIFKFDYYTLIKEEFLRYLITDIEDAHFELSSNEIKSQFEGISNIIFFKLYLDELISLGLLNGEKIYPNISNMTENYFYYADEALINDGGNSIFSIPSILSEEYIDNRNDCFSELAKVYYSFYPLISYEAYSVQTYINQTFLIAYKIDDNKNIIGKELYFNFPRLNDNFLNNNNFHPYNNFISPKINISKYENSTLINDSFYFENWFIKEDYNFRSLASDTFDLSLDYLHLNFNHEGKINKTTILIMQTFYKNNNNEKFIINIIYFINQKNLSISSFDHSVFTINNFTNNLDNKFSDNQTFVISKYQINEMSLSSLISEYFHFGLFDNNNNFYGKGIFYDSIDLNLLSEPTKYYSTIKGFNYDIRYFTPFYLYTKLFQKIPYIKNYSKEENIYKYYFNDSWHIKNICNKFNFSVYKSNLNAHDINCFDKKNLLYYYKEKETSSVVEEISLPYCICLPLYCIKNLKSNFDSNNIEYVDDITLPEKCQNNLKFYQNEITEQNKSNNEIDTSKLRLIMGEKLNKQLENQFIKFTYEKFELLGGLSFIIISIIDNASLKIILSNLINNLNKVRTIFIFYIGIGIFFMAVWISIYVLINIYQISKSIYAYKEKLLLFIFQIQLNSSNKKDNMNINKIGGFILNDKNNLENFPLLENEYIENKEDGSFNNSLNNRENILLDDLFLIYCKFYKISEEKIDKHNENNKKVSKSKMRIKALTNNNELFKLFCIISLYIPQFKLDISIDFDFYKDSKLMNNFLKCITKKSSYLDKEQIIYTKSILYELISTELINDYGLITNLNFKYLTNINLDSYKKNNPVQKAIFKQVEELEKKDRKMKDKILNDDYNNPNIKLVWKNKNLIMKFIEEKFEQDDYLQLNKLESSFNTSLINAFYNYSNKIIILKDNDS